MTIHRIDVEPILHSRFINKITKDELVAFRDKIVERIKAGEHIHLYGMGAEECVYPGAQCWKGIRKC